MELPGGKTYIIRKLENVKRTISGLTAMVLFFSLFFLTGGDILFAQKTAYIVPIHGDIDRYMLVFIKRGIREGEKLNSDYIIFDINSTILSTVYIMFFVLDL